MDLKQYIIILATVAGIIFLKWLFKSKRPNYKTIKQQTQHRDTTAQYNIGVMYQQGQGVKQSRDFTQSADQHHADAQSTSHPNTGDFNVTE